MIEFIKRLWAAIKPDPYFYIESLMELEGYTDFEIEQEIKHMKAHNDNRT